MNYFLERANEMKDEMVAIRRRIHQNAGIGFDIRENADLIREELAKMGIESTEVCECGVTATIGHGGKCIMLRADYDALPMAEESGLPFAATNGTCHACGHDLNATNLLFAAKMLKERESELKGTVKLMFQPAEEIGAGALAMIRGGLLENPKVDAAVSLHGNVGAPGAYVGTTGYTRGPTFAACDKLIITVRGKGGHGAEPHGAVNPLVIAAQIILALQNIIPSEVNSTERNVLTMCSIVGGKAPNVIQPELQLLGTLRTVDDENRAFIKKRIVEVCEGIAQAMRGEVVCDLDSASLPATVSNVDMCDAIHPYLAEICGAENVAVREGQRMGSEDFSEVASRVPSVGLGLGAGAVEEGYTVGVHNPTVRFKEECLPYGAAIFANVAFSWLRDHSEN